MEKTVYGTSSPACVGGGFPRGGMPRFSFLPSWSWPFSFCWKQFVSPVYAPNRFLAGIFFGVPAGFLEEVGWMGYAFPKMRSQHDAFDASILLGLLWASWHLPVINYLGTATPHGAYWYAFFLAFTVAMICHACLDLLDLHQHRKRAFGPVHACEFHRFPGHFQRPARECRARSVLVRSLWNFVVGPRRDHCEDLWQASRATDCLESELFRNLYIRYGSGIRKR